MEKHAQRDNNQELSPRALQNLKMGKKGRSQQKDIKGAALGKRGETQDVSRRGKWPTVKQC